MVLGPSWRHFRAACPRFPGSNTEIQLQAAIKNKRELCLGSVPLEGKVRLGSCTPEKVELLSCASRRFRLETLFVMDATQDWSRRVDSHPVLGRAGSPVSSDCTTLMHQRRAQMVSVCVSR